MTALQLLSVVKAVKKVTNVLHNKFPQLGLEELAGNMNRIDINTDSPAILRERIREFNEKVNSIKQNLSQQEIREVDNEISSGFIDNGIPLNFNPDGTPTVSMDDFLNKIDHSAGVVIETEIPDIDGADDGDFWSDLWEMLFG